MTGAGLGGPRRRALLVRVVDDEDVGVGLLVLGPGVVLVGIGAEAARVHRQHVDGGLAVGDPAGELPAGAAGGGDAEAEAFRQPEVRQPVGRPDERVAVRRVGNGAVDAILDAGVAEHRHPVHRGFDMRLQAVHVRRQQLLPETLGNAVHRPGRRSLLVGPENQALALFAHVVGGVALAQHRQFGEARLPALDEFGDGVGDEVLVLDRDRRQVEAHHGAHLPRPGAGGGHHGLAGDVAAIGLDQPFAGAGALDARHLGVAVDLRAPVARALGQGLRHVHRRDMAVMGVEEGAHQPVEVGERPEVADLVGADQLEGDADGVRGAAIVAILVHPLLIGGEPEIAGAMKTYRLAGLRLELLIEVDAVLVELADAVAHVEEWQQPGRVPGGAGGELGLLDQHHVGPAQFGQMVEHAAADDAAADHHHPRLILHASPLLSLHARPTGREPYHARTGFTFPSGAGRSLRSHRAPPRAWTRDATRLAARRRGRAGRATARPGPPHVPHRTSRLRAAGGRVAAMAGRLDGKVALITGAGSVGPGWGNGRATSVLFAREGARVVALDRDPAAAEATREIVLAEGGACVVETADATDGAQVARAIAASVERWGALHVLVNNVGGSVPGGPVELSEADWAAQLDFNLTSAFLATRCALPVMEAQGAGAIVNISSVAGLRFIGNHHAAYAAAKAGLVQFTKTVGVQYAARGVRCNSISVGLMHTPLVEARLAAQYGSGNLDALVAKRHAQVPMGRMGSGWDVAHAALYLASDEAGYVTAADLVVDGGLTAKCD